MTLTLVTAAAFLPYCHFLMRAEEKRLREIYRTTYDQYMKKTRRFWPSFALPDEPAEYIVRPRPFRNAVRDALCFLWAIGLVELAEALHEHDMIPQLLRLY